MASGAGVGHRRTSNIRAHARNAERHFGIRSPGRRLSVPSNIVEGNAHASPHEFTRYLRDAVASASEVEGHAQLSHDLGIMDNADFTTVLARVVDVRKMLHGLLKRLGKRTPDNG